MNFKKLGYWIATLLVALVMLGGGAADFMLIESVTQTMDHLGSWGCGRFLAPSPSSSPVFRV